MMKEDRALNANDLTHGEYVAEITYAANKGCPVSTALCFLEFLKGASAQPSRSWWQDLLGRRRRWWRILGLAALAVVLLAWLL